MTTPRGASRGGTGADDPMPWWRAEPERLRRDRQDLEAHFPELSWSEPPRAVRGAGGWRGQLPRWPFERRAPEGIDRLPLGLELELVYSQAHPVIAPSIYPLDPEPEITHYTDHRWHLNGDGSLCLLRDASQWTGSESVVELLLKAAGWRVEFALMSAGLLERMTETGIATDPVLDTLISYLPGSGRPAGAGEAPTLVSSAGPVADGVGLASGQATP